MPKRPSSLAAPLLLLLPLLPLLLAARAERAPAEPSQRPNVLLVSIDSLRRDFVGSYGARMRYAPGISPTPVLDAFADRGTRFTEAYASSPWTLPSHVSLLTGQAPMVHEVESDLQTLSPDMPTLAGSLRDRGWRTAGVFSGPYLEPEWGLGKGFETYRAEYGPAVATASASLDSLDAQIAAAVERGDRVAARELRWQRRKAYERVRSVSHGDVSSERVTAAALEEIDRLSKGPDPWLLFVHYFDVHYDYVPPPPWKQRFDPEYTGEMTGEGFLTNPAVAVERPDTLGDFVRRVGDRDLEHLRALYAGEVAWVDAQVGRLLARLDELGSAERTLVVIVSDHGDEFFEHGGIGHRRTLFDEVLRIPLLMRLPGVVPAGRVTPGAVSLADVLPTVLDVAGVPIPEHLSGRSLLPLLRGAEDPGSRTLISRLLRFYEGDASIDGSEPIAVRLAVVQEAFRRGPIKIVRRRQWPLFPPGLPPEQRETLAAAADEQFQKEDLAWIDLDRVPSEAAEGYSTDFSEPRAAAALAAFQERYGELRARYRAKLAPAIDPELRGRLEGLGYADDGGGTPAPGAPRDGFQLPPPGDRTASRPE